MTTNTSRRSLLAGLSAAPVALVPTLPAMATPHPDAELFALIASWRVLQDDLDAATEAVWDAEDSRRDIAVPDAMFERDADMDLFHVTYAHFYGPERRWYPPDGRGHRYLKSIVGLMERHGKHGERASERFDRAKEILESIAAYSAERAKAERECNLDVAEAEQERLRTQTHALTLQIVTLQARTIEGVLRKTVLLAEIYPGGKDFSSPTQGLERRLNDGCALDDLVSFGIARDLLELAKQGGAHV